MNARAGWSVFTRMLALALAALATDPFGLGVPWSGTLDALASSPVAVHDVEGLRAAVARGGYIRLAAGTYRLSGTPLFLHSSTMLEGAGKEATILEVGAQYVGGAVPKEGECEIGLFGSDIGLRRMTIRNANPTAKLNGFFRGHWAGPNERVFLDAVRFRCGNALPVTLTQPTDALIRGCSFVSTSPTQGALDITGGLRFRFESNFVEYRAGRTVLALMTKATIAHNHFRIDGRYRGKGRVETGGVELSYASDVDFEHNEVLQYGLGTAGDNDGEMVMTQASTLPEWQGAGRVVSVSGTTLATDLDWGDDRWFAPRYPVTRRKAAYLLTGAGAGQWRWATAAGKGRVTLDRPWKTPPRAGDRVSIGSVTAYGLRIRNNLVEGGGILLYNGGLECDVSGNTVMEGNGIVLRGSSDSDLRTSHTTDSHWALWNDKATGNTVRNTKGFNLANLDVMDADVSDTGLPLAVWNVKVVGNTIVGKNQSHPGPGMLLFDGIQVITDNQGGDHRPRPERQAGVVVRDNHLTGAVERLLPTTNRGA